MYILIHVTYEDGYYSVFEREDVSTYDLELCSEEHGNIVSFNIVISNTKK